MFEKIKNYYENGLWTEKRVNAAVEKGAITEEQYYEITGNYYPYSPSFYTASF